jgi:maltooligosyltrehalose synthase
MNINKRNFKLQWTHGAALVSFIDLFPVGDVIADAGWSNALALKLLALTVPGVPDVYQGSELWEQSLVDPDNRRPVDFDERVGLLADLDGGARPTLSGGVDDPGAAKLLVTRAALGLRRDRSELFGSYTPLPATGEAGPSSSTATPASLLARNAANPPP